MKVKTRPSQRSMPKHWNSSE